MQKLISAASQIMQISVDSADYRRAVAEILEICVRASNAKSGRVYLLNLMTSAYEIAWEIGSESYEDRYELRTLEAAAERHQSLGILEDVLTRRKPALVEMPPRLVVPLVRQGACVGLIDVDATTNAHFQSGAESLVHIAASAISLLAENERSLKLFKELHKSVSYHQSEADFYEAMMKLVASASQMPYIVLREIIDEDLVCIGSHGFDQIPKDRLNLSPIGEVSTFAEVVRDGRPKAERTMDANHLESLRLKPELKHVKSFVVVPVKVGTKVVGTLSFGAECTYEYSDLEKNAFETIANSVGVAITNHRNFNAVGQQQFEFGKLSADLTAVEVAQAARHEARGYLAEIKEEMVVLDGLVQRGTKRDLDNFRARLRTIDDLARDIEISIDRIKDATKPPKSELVCTDLRELWGEAFNMVTGRLNNLHIDYKIEGKAKCTVYPDHLKHVFLNLVLNSIDAFGARSKKGGRQIQVIIKTGSAKSQNVEVRYMDNATGIDVSKLPPDDNGKPRTVDQIFERNVSGKGGSGYGLFLARNILSRHHGSIVLVSYRNGVVFDICLPKDSSEHSLAQTSNNL